MVMVVHISQGVAKQQELREQVHRTLRVGGMRREGNQLYEAFLMFSKSQDTSLAFSAAQSCMLPRHRLKSYCISEQRV